ncbi:hypothetical protein MTR67_040221 [Solanum verrucosum]|uniref:Uncharacterized protein n=1 Tax=Solanum verrucosum TaxID=315347 RepID=A0AAF0UJS0_SOLVR|nr:hypothetical protein MTR67_040221 [Solanum verrucosum]
MSVDQDLLTQPLT